MPSNAEQLLRDYATVLAGERDDASLAAAIFNTVEADRNGIARGGVALPATEIKGKLSDHDDEALFSVRIASGVDVLSNVDARKLYNLSPRIVDIRLVVERKHVYIDVARAAATSARRLHIRAAPSKRRLVEDAFESVSSRDDQSHISQIVGEVYDIAQIVPDMHYWYEPISADGSSGRHTPLAAELASESSLDHASPSLAAATVVGYAIVFQPIVSTVSASFFEYLLENYGSFVSHVYVWFQRHRNSSAPMLVINIRSSHATVEQANRATKAHLPKGNPVKRVKRK